MFPLVLDLAADGIAVAVTCRVLGFSKRAFYQWLKQPITDSDWADARLINAAIDIHHDDPGVRLPVHHRRADPCRQYRRPQAGEPALHPATALVGAREEARPQPAGRGRPCTRPCRARVHC
jgi:hypothetical protein